MFQRYYYYRLVICCKMQIMTFFYYLLFTLFKIIRLVVVVECSTPHLQFEHLSDFILIFKLVSIATRYQMVTSSYISEYFIAVELGQYKCTCIFNLLLSTLPYMPHTYLPSIFQLLQCHQKTFELCRLKKQRMEIFTPWVAWLIRSTRYLR